MRLRALAWALALAGCVVDGDDPPDTSCAAGELRVCRADGDCRCAATCTPGSSCTLASMAVAVCAPLSTGTGLGACVERAWINAPTNVPFRCGESEVCGAGDACVNWSADGIHCAGACTTNADCGSGCCVEVGTPGTSEARHVCAPNTNYRCESSSPAGRACSPACASGEACMMVGATPRCLPRCVAGASQCGATCCVASPDRVSVCAPATTLCGADGGTSLRASCTSFDACVTVTSATRGDHCASADSIEVRVRNDCAQPVDVEICYEARDGRCVCGNHSNVMPGTEADPPFWACGLTGRYRLSARAAGDAPGCHPGRCN